MHPVDDIGIAIADVYAKAVYKLASDAGTTAPTLEELSGLIAYVNSTPEFESFLVSVTVDSDRRRATIEKAMRGKASDLLVNLVQTLNAKSRLCLLEQVYVQYRLANEVAQNQAEITVATAVPLSADQRGPLLEALRKYTGQEPILTERVDDSLIGGLVVYIDDQKIDFSVSRALGGYRESFLRRASQEIHGKKQYVQ